MAARAAGNEIQLLVLGTNSLRRLLEFHSIAVSILDKSGSGYRTAVELGFSNVDGILRLKVPLNGPDLCM